MFLVVMGRICNQNRIYNIFNDLHNDADRQSHTLQLKLSHSFWVDLGSNRLAWKYRSASLGFRQGGRSSSQIASN